MELTSTANASLAEMFGPVIEADAKAILKPGRNEIELRPLKILKHPAVALDLKVHGPTANSHASSPPPAGMASPISAVFHRRNGGLSRRFRSVKPMITPNETGQRRH